LTGTGEPSWTVRAAGPNDAASVADLFGAVFGKPLSERAYRWKYLDSPCATHAPTSFVAMAQGRVVGHFGGTPMRVRIGGRDVTAVHGSGAMVAAEFRRRGIMVALMSAANAAWATGGASFQLAVPNQNLYGLRERLDYRPTFLLRWLWRPLWLTRRRSSGEHEVTPVAAGDPSFDELWNALAPADDALVVRDSSWIGYRYGADAPFDYRVLVAREHGSARGYLVYRLMPDERRSAWIADLFGAPEARRDLLRAAVAELGRAGARDVRVFAARPSAVWGELIRARFVPRRGAYDVRVTPFAQELPWDVLRDSRRFLLAGGDFDVV